MKTNNMIKKLGFLVCFLIFVNCSEGDIIDIRVDDVVGELENCSNDSTNTFVFFVVDQATNRSLSVNFTDTSFEIEPNAASDISLVEPTIITLNATNNQFLYRVFDTTINGVDYFCNSVPVSNINVTQELVSANGTAEISYEIVDQTDPNQTIYSRTVILKNVTLEGNGIAIRKEFLPLGSDSITIPN